MSTLVPEALLLVGPLPPRPPISWGRGRQGASGTCILSPPPHPVQTAILPPHVNPLPLPPKPLPPTSSLSQGPAQDSRGFQLLQGLPFLGDPSPVWKQPQGQCREPTWDTLHGVSVCSALARMGHFCSSPHFPDPHLGLVSPRTPFTSDAPNVHQYSPLTC